MSICEMPKQRVSRRRTRAAMIIEKELAKMPSRQEREHKQIRKTLKRHAREDKAMLAKMAKHKPTKEHKRVAAAMKKSGHM